MKITTNIKLMILLTSSLVLSSFMENATAAQVLQSDSRDLLSSSKGGVIQPSQIFLPNSLLVHWRVSAQDVTIYLADKPDQTTMKLVAEKVTGNSYLLEHQTGKRPYIFIKPRGQIGFWVAERILPLEGGVNFRDLGGYRSEDGRTVAWGKLYRSGTMSDLTGSDYEYLSQLGIKTFCDFRAIEERLEEPTLYTAFAPAAKMLTQDYSMRELMSDDFGKALVHTKTREQALEVFGGFYRKGIDSYAEQFKNMFAELLLNKSPLSFNCSAGKDRTGMAAALVLSALGVPRDVVVADYALSEQAYDFGLREMKKRIKNNHSQSSESPHTQLFAKLPTEVINVFMGTDPALIEAFFAEIELQYGTVQHYLRQKMALSDEDIQTLRKLYLVSNT